MCRNCENTSKPLSVKSDSASEYAISHIHSNIYDFSTIKEGSSGISSDSFYIFRLPAEKQVWIYNESCG